MKLFSGNNQVSPRRIAAGFSLIEILIALGIFSLIAGSIFLSYVSISDVVDRTRLSTLTTSLLNKQIELLRNLPYDNVGVIGGSPPGVLPATSTAVYEGKTFQISSFVRNIDDPFDGQLGQTPGDTAPADYKLVEIQIICTSCGPDSVPLIFTTTVSPQNLETSTKNGSLFINVFDANGLPISNANVLVKNTTTTPSITINDATNSSGTLQLVDVPTSTNSYEVTVSKSGYTTSKTYLPGAASNPNPTRPHATVASQLITAVSFAIDRLSTIAVTTHDQFCAGIASVPLIQSGQKLIGTSPSVLSYSSSFSTDSSGKALRSGLEWDTYSFVNASSSAFDIAGAAPLLPVALNPNASGTLDILMEPKTTNSLLVTVINGSSSPLLGASVNLMKSGFNQTQQTGEKSTTETTWIPPTGFSAQNGSVDATTVPGQLTLMQISPGAYATGTSWLISNTIDFGTSGVNYHQLSWNPTTQPPNTTLQFQLASSNNAAGPFVFVGPNNTPATFYTAPGPINPAHNGQRYLQYQVFLTTNTSAVSPILTDVSISFDSSCVPPGQTFWPGLTTGTYNLTASMAGYATATSSVTVGAGWQEVTIQVQ